MKALSIRTYLTRLIWLCVLPLVLLTCYLSFHHVDSLQSQLNQEAADRVHDVLTAIESRIEAQIAGLQLLAASSLANDTAHTKEFYEEAQGFRESFGGHVILADLSLQMRFNTRVPFGTTLPKLPQPEGHAAAPAVLATGEPAVGDMFPGPIAKETLVAVVVPVIHGGGTKSLLLSTIETSQFQRLVDNLTLPRGWSLTLLDGKSEVMARRAFVGSEGGTGGEKPSRRFVANSTVAPWSVVLEIPRSVYRAPIVRAVAALAVAILAISFISILVGSQAARRLARSVATLTATRTPEYSRPVIAEVEEIRGVLAEAAEARKAADSARRESEQRIRNLFEQAADGIFVITPDHRYVDANEAGLRMLGYSHEELLRLHVSDVLVESERSRLDVEVPVMMAGTPHLAEWLHRRKDGTTFPAEVSARPISGNEYLAIVRDLTERRRTEEALREQDRLIGAIADTSPAIIYVYDMTTGSNVYANAGIARLLGYSPHEVRALGAELFGRLIHPDDLPEVIAFQSRILAAQDEDILEIGYRMKHRDGTWRSLSSFERPFKRNEDGSVRQKIGVAIDISDRKRAAEELRESEERYRNLLDVAPVGIAVHSDGKVVFTNPAGARLLGADTEEQIVGKPVTEIIHPDGLPKAQSRIQKMMAGERGLYPAEDVYLRLDGTPVNVEVMATLLTYRGRPAVQVIVTDITERRRSEEALRTSEARYRTLVEQASDGIFLSEASGMFLEVNARGCTMLGYPRKEILAKHLWDLIPPEDLAAAPIKFDELRTGKGVVTERRLICKDGSLLPVEISSRMLPDGHLQGIVRDITERKQAEERLRNLNRVYRIMSEINQAIVRIPEPTAIFNEACRIAVQEGGFLMAWVGLVDEAGGKVEPVARAGDTDGYLERLQITLSDEPHGRGPSAIALRAGKHEVCNDIQHDPRMAPWREDALRHGYRASVALPLIVNGKVRGTFNLYAGEPGFFIEAEMRLLDELAVNISFAMEVAERDELRQRAVKSLCVSEANLRMAQALARMGSWTYDLSGRITWSDEMYRIYGVSPETFMPNAESFISLIHPDDRLAMEKWIRACTAGERPGELEFRVVLPDGTVHFICGQGELIADADGRPTHMAGTAQDITERRRLEDQLRQAQKLEGIGQLAGGIAHDFNNVLGAVMGLAGILQMRMSEDDPLRHYTDELVAAGERGANLTRQILAFSRKQVFDLKPVRLNGIVRGLEKMLRRLLPESIDISQDLYKEDPVVLVDTGQIEQVLINLATNARDAIAGIGRIGIATERFTMDRSFVESHGYGEPGEYAVLAVTDTGRGMDAATRARIFEPFFTTKEPGKGTGLGLAVVYGIVKQHRGFINVYSEVGKGTVIRVYLPLAAGAVSVITTTEPVARIAGGSETILIAEDDEILRKLSLTSLGQHGYTVIEAGDGEDAVAKFATNQDTIRLVILDGLMPKMGGVEALEKIRRLCPGIKAVFMSGYADDVFSGGGLRDKAAAFIQKPVMPTDLLRMVREVLDR